MPERRGEGARGWVFTTAKIRVLADKNLDFPGKLAGRLPQNSQKIIPVSKVGLDRDIVPIRLPKGTTPILLKITNNLHNWGFFFRLTDSQGRQLKNVKFSLSPG